MWLRETSVMLVVGLLLAATVTTTSAEEDEQPAPTGQWDGFISCAVGTPMLTWQTCATLPVVSNDDWIHTFSVDEGLHKLVVVMEWETSTLSVGDELTLFVEDQGSGIGGPSHATVTGESPIVVEIEDLQTWENGRHLQYRIFPSFDFQFVYQQDFTVTWYEFYEEPPEDFDLSAADKPVHPGDRMSTGSSYCTLGFVFDGVGPQEGEVYFSTNAHCVSEIGQSVSAGESDGFAEVVYIHPGDDNTLDDFAFLRVDTTHEHRVQAEVRGHTGMPVGHTTSPETEELDTVLFSGHGTVFNMHEFTRENRSGPLTFDNGTKFRALAPIIFGDSGGPALHEPTGKPLGLVATIRVCCAQVYETMGPTVTHMVDEAAANDFHIQLRTVE